VHIKGWDLKGWDLTRSFIWMTFRTKLTQDTKGTSQMSQMWLFLFLHMIISKSQNWII
jgi:hypothetical protein